MSNFPPNGLVPQDLVVSNGVTTLQHFTEAPVLITTDIKVGQGVHVGMHVVSGVDTVAKHKVLEDSRTRPA
jgi:hypothetical protein